MLIVAKHELNPALIDRVPLAGVKHRLKFIEARGGRRPMTVAIPGKPASAAQPPAQSIQGGQRDQTDSQARDGHEEQHSHERLTQRAVSAFHDQGDDELAARLCALAGWTPQIRHRVDSIDLVIDMVLTGHGVGLLPADAPGASRLPTVPLLLAPTDRRMWSVRAGTQGWAAATAIIDAVRQRAQNIDTHR